MRLIDPRAIIDQIVISLSRMSAAYAFHVVLPKHQLARAKKSAQSALRDYASDPRLPSGPFISRGDGHLSLRARRFDPRPTAAVLPPTVVRSLSA